MKAVHFDIYGAAQEVLRVEAHADEPDMAPNDVKIRVIASSLNPIDCKRRMAYGHNVYKAMGSARAPITPGLDFSGIVEEVGERATTFKVGDEVWGAQETFRPGTHGEYACVRAHDVSIKPANLTHEEAASLPYVALSTWNAFMHKAKISTENAGDRRILIHGGGGGIGTFAIQLMKAWGAYVVTTCSPDKMALARELGADEVIDYTQIDFTKAVKDIDVVLDTVGGDVMFRSVKVLRRDHTPRIVSFHSPLMPMTDKYGPRRGFAMVLLTGMMRKARIGIKGAFYRDAYFNPDADALDEIRTLIEAGKIRPVIDSVYSIDDAVAAHEHLESGATKGKVVLKIGDAA